MIGSLWHIHIQAFIVQGENTIKK